MKPLRGGGAEVPCNCVFRSIFRACLRKFRECSIKDRSMGHPMLECSPRRGSRVTWGRKSEEYCADFCLVARRVLNDREHQIFKFHYLLGADWRMCCQRLGLDRGNFFHEVYRIENKLGRVFAEVEPYALFPIGDYFSRSSREPVYSSLRLTKVVRMPLRPVAPAALEPVPLPLAA